MGRIGAPFGVRGRVRVSSYTDPPEAIFGYSPWRVTKGASSALFRDIEGRRQGSGLTAMLADDQTREGVADLRGAEIAVARSSLPGLVDGEHYWVDLIGLEVVNQDGVCLGAVKSLMETGANDVLVVKGERERLIPYLPEQVIRDVDIDAGRIAVDWDPEF